jgi:hypothetical protein
MVLAENRSECRVAGTIHSLRLLVIKWCDDSEGDAQANAFLRSEARLPVAWLPILAVPARTLRSPTAAIGTELLAHREKIEVTRCGSPFERSPVPMAPAHRP